MLKKVAVCSRSFSRNEFLREELLQRFPETKFNDEGLSLQGGKLVGFLQGVDAAIVALEKITEEIVCQLPVLKVISKYGVGIDNIDLKALEEHKIQFAWTPGVNKRSVSELVIAFAISLLRNLPESMKLVLAGDWRQVTGNQLTGKCFGVIGCGNIGQDLVTLLKPFGCRVLVHDIQEYPGFFRENGLKNISLDELLSESDIISLHLPLDSSTSNLLSAEKLQLIKKGAILINTARGGLVDEKKLKELLVNDHLGGVAFDVFATEPPDDPELLQLPNFMATPHIGGSSVEAIQAMGMAAIQGLEEYVAK